MKNIGFSLLIALIILSLSLPAYSKDVIRFKKGRKQNFNAQQYERKSYFLKLLRLTLEASKAEFGDYDLQPAAVTMKGDRLDYNLANNKGIDIIWRSTAKKASKKIIPIDIPLLRGYDGLMLGVIKKSEQERFNNIITLEQMKTFKIGRFQGKRKDDIFNKNGFNIALANRLQVSYRHLKKGFTDYLPMHAYGAHLHLHQNPTLAVEKSIAINLPFTLNFYVNANNKKLFKRIKRGLEIIESNGTFKQHFDTHSMMEPYQKLSRQPPRKIFHLK